MRANDPPVTRRAQSELPITICLGPLSLTPLCTLAVTDLDGHREMLPYLQQQSTNSLGYRQADKQTTPVSWMGA